MNSRPPPLHFLSRDSVIGFIILFYDMMRFYMYVAETTFLDFDFDVFQYVLDFLFV